MATSHLAPPYSSSPAPSSAASSSSSLPSSIASSPDSNSPTSIQISHATEGFARFLNDDVSGAIQQLDSEPNSPFHLVARGLVAHILAVLSMETATTDTALNMLAAAEKRAQVVRATVSGTSKRLNQWLPAGLEYDLLVADSQLCQAALLMGCETYLQFYKGIMKVKNAYGTFQTAGKTVFGDSVTPDCTVRSLIDHLNRAYASHLSAAAEPAPPPTPSGTIKGGWLLGRLAGSRANTATGTVPTIKSLNGEKAVGRSAPGSGTVTPALSEKDFAEKLKLEGRHSLSVETNGTAKGTGESAVPLSPFDAGGMEPNWLGCSKTSLTVAGAAFGYGAFSLILSLTPPKFRSILSWVGYKGLPRREALKVLTVAAMTGYDTHSCFAALTLLFYYGTVVPMSGWLANEADVFAQMTRLVDRVQARFPEGTLWTFNRIKLDRMRRETGSAITQLKAALERSSAFEQGRTILQFELCWCLTSEGRFAEAADAFDQMRHVNDWSPATYLYCATGCMIELLQRREKEGDLGNEERKKIEERIRYLLDETPKMMGKKKVMGSVPPTETFIKRKLAFYKEKHARWVAAGRLKGKAADPSEVWRVIKVSPSQEVSLFWNAHQRSPLSRLEDTISDLLALSPALDPASVYDPSVISASGSLQLDSGDEIAIRDLILGTCYRNLNKLDLARTRLQAVLDAEAAGVIKSDLWVPAMAHYELAVLECVVATQGSIALRAKGQTKTNGHAASDAEDGKDLGEIASASEVSLWKKRFEAAKVHITAMGNRADFDLSQRLHTRCMVLEGEMDEKKRSLGIS